MTRLWTLGTLVPSLPSLFKDFLTTYWQTSYSLERSSSFKILLAFWGCNCWDTVVPVGLGISFSSFFTMIKLRTQIGLHRIKQTCASSLQLSIWEMPLTHSRKTLLSAPTTDSDHIALPSSQSDLCGPRVSHRKHESGIHRSLCCVSQCVSGAAEWEEIYTADHWGGSSKEDLSLHALFSFLRQGLTV